jgi:iron complex outermembrane receptor protein
MICANGIRRPRTTPLLLIVALTVTADVAQAQTRRTASSSTVVPDEAAPNGGRYRDAAITSARRAALPAPEAGSDSATDDEPAAKSPATDDPLNMDIEQLGKAEVVVPSFDQPVNSVTRQESTVGRSPAAVLVINQEMIRRSGAQAVPELLRMVPGVDVAKIDSNQWAVSIRGFNNRFANKLLVMVDRRIVYSPTFGGVFWDTTDLMLQDVERIEVVRGPGATVWGTNAMNGVIAIYTKAAKDTQGAIVASGGGTYERNFENIRVGGTAGRDKDIKWRVWGRQFERSQGYNPAASHDGWNQARIGYRVDWRPSKQDLINTQGDLYNGMSGQALQLSQPTPPFQQLAFDNPGVRGGNVMLRWNHEIDEDTNWQFQTYYYEYIRDWLPMAESRRNWYTDFQYHLALGERHKVTAGANYWLSADSTHGDFEVALQPPRFVTNWASAFVQDEIELAPDRWYFIAGTKFEQNTFGGFQVEPSLRLLFLPSQRRSIWASVSRAVRMPSRIDGQAVANTFTSSPPPTFFALRPGGAVLPEDLLAYELGYRAQPNDRFSWDVATFINRYQHLIGTSPAVPTFAGGDLFLVSQWANNVAGMTYGVELTGNLKIRDKWSVVGSYTWFQPVLHSTSSPTSAAQFAGPNPRNQVYLRSSWDLPRNVQFDLIPRYVGRLAYIDVPAYFTMDMRLAWQPTKNMELSLVGQNLLQPHHLEFVDFQAGLVSTQVPRGVYGMITWTY